MNTETYAGMVIGGAVGGAVAGPLGALAGGALGGLVGDAYSKKPAVETFATTLRNDLAPENVTLDAHQIYVRITTGHGRDTLQAASESAKELMSGFADRSDQIAAVRSATTEAWQGAASSSAASASVALSDSLTLAQGQLAATAQALDAELAAFDHIRSQVEPVPATPPQSGIANAVNPFQTDVDAAINDYNAKAAKNVRLYEAYSADTAAARSQVPQSYAEPVPLTGSASATTGTASAIGTTSVAPPQVGPAAAGGQPAATGASAAPGGTAPLPPAAGGVPGGPGGTAGQGAAASDPAARQIPSATAPAASGAVTPVPPALGAPAGGPLTGRARTPGISDQHRGPAGAVPGLGRSGAFGAGAGARGIGGGTGTGGGAGARGAGPSVGTGPVSGQTPPGQGQPAGRAALGAAAARGAAGLGGMPVGAAGRPDGEEDREHRRKYLIEPDDKELFGIDELCAPPVIGDRR